jgi:single-stranded DNA-binding protein
MTKEKPSKDNLSDLNSLLIEGTIKIPPYKIPETEPACYFTLENKRYYGVGKHNKLIENKCYVPIEVKGELAESILSLGKKGSRVRVVGALRQGPFYTPDKKKHDVLYMTAEHAELKTS